MKLKKIIFATLTGTSLLFLSNYLHFDQKYKQEIKKIDEMDLYLKKIKQTDDRNTKIMEKCDNLEGYIIEEGIEQKKDQIDSIRKTYLKATFFLYIARKQITEIKQESISKRYFYMKKRINPFHKIKPKEEKITEYVNITEA